MPDNPMVIEIILERLKHLENKLDQNNQKSDERLKAIESKVNWALGLATAIGALMTATGQKIYSIIFGA